MATDELVTSLVQLVQLGQLGQVGQVGQVGLGSAPPVGDADDLRRRCADALEQRGERALAMTLLAPLVNFTSHDDTAPLPCLCKRCLAAAGDSASAKGMAFHRTFAVWGNRVLYFWLPDELADDRTAAKRAVAEGLRVRLARKARRAEAE